MGRLLASTVVLLAAVTLLAGAADAAPGLKVGVTDDAWLEFGPGTLEERVVQLQTMGVQVVRVTLDWYEVEAEQGTYDWARDGMLLDALRTAGITPVVAIWGTPAWANGGARPNVPPTSAASSRRSRARPPSDSPGCGAGSSGTSPTSAGGCCRRHPRSTSRSSSTRVAPRSRTSSRRPPSPAARRRHGVRRVACPPSTSSAAWGARARTSTRTPTIRTRSHPRRRRSGAGAPRARRSAWQRSTGSSTPRERPSGRASVSG